MRGPTVDLLQRARVLEPGFSPYRLQMKAQMMIAGLQLGDLRRRLIQPDDGAFRRYLDERPEIVGILVWPYGNPPIFERAVQ